MMMLVADYEHGAVDGKLLSVIACVGAMYACCRPTKKYKRRDTSSLTSASLHFG